jgi:hypothetical protein
MNQKTSRVTRLFTRVATIAVIALAGQSCVQENLDRCPPGVIRVYFAFTSGEPLAATRQANAISTIDLFAFDDSSRLAGHWVDDRVVMSETYSMVLDGLEAGTYHLVAWTNLDRQHYSASFQPALPRDSATVSLLLPADRKLRDVTLPPLHFGDYREARVARFNENRYLMALEDNLYTLNFRVEGITPGADTYRFTVTDNNGTYSFNNTCKEMPPFDYIATTRFNNAPHLTASMTVLHLDEHRTPALAFHDETTGQLLFSHDNLVALILQANLQGASIDFRLTREFDILLRVHAGTLVAVSINGWSIRSDTSQIS